MDRLVEFLALVAPMLLFSVIAHEIAHGYAALKQGDPTAYQLGRLTWNPIKHIDPFFTVLLPTMMYLMGGGILGGAKPVPVNPRNYRNFKRGDIIVSLAGVVTNLAIAVGCLLAVGVFAIIARFVPSAVSFSEIAQGVFLGGIVLNWVLIIFNLIPIPPLDGSHVMKYLLPPAWSLQYAEFGSRFGFLLLIALVFMGSGVIRTLLYPAMYMATVFIGLVDPLVLPGAGRWFPYGR